MKRKTKAEQAEKIAKFYKSDRLKDKASKFIFLLEKDDQFEALIIAKKLELPSVAAYIRKIVKESNKRYKQLLHLS